MDDGRTHALAELGDGAAAAALADNRVHSFNDRPHPRIQTPFSLHFTVRLEQNDRGSQSYILCPAAAAAAAQRVGLFQVLPAWYSANYISLLPGESKAVRIECQTESSGLTVEIEGWNTAPLVLKVAPPMP